MFSVSRICSDFVLNYVQNLLQTMIRLCLRPCSDFVWDYVQTWFETMFRLRVYVQILIANIINFCFGLFSDFFEYVQALIGK